VSAVFSEGLAGDECDAIEKEIDDGGGDLFWIPERADEIEAGVGSERAVGHTFNRVFARRPYGAQPLRVSGYSPFRRLRATTKVDTPVTTSANPLGAAGLRAAPVLASHSFATSSL
jgi:hypothetical protein